MTFTDRTCKIKIYDRREINYYKSREKWRKTKSI